MSKVQSAMAYMRRRSKLPSGDRISSLGCVNCASPILCWNDDAMLTPLYPYRVLCSYCKSAERAENAAIFGRQR